MRLPHPVHCCLFLMLLFFVPAAAQDAPGLVVAWVDGGDLSRWADGNATQIASDVLEPFLSPDGQQLVFTERNVEAEFVEDAVEPRSLWLWDAATQESKELVNTSMLAEGQVIVYLEWLDSGRILFNTGIWNMLGSELLDDLWLIEVETGTVTQLLEAGTGGNFTISPDKTRLALVTSGRPEESDGQIRIYELENGTFTDGLTFPSVNTASEYYFYPAIFWEADGQAFRTVIPHAETIYRDDGSLPAALWRITISGEAEQIGDVSASLFGLPMWSFDAQHVLYMSRVGGVTSNDFNLLTAAGDGSESVVYASGEAGQISLPLWLPDAAQFVYGQGEFGSYWLGQPGEQPLQLSGTISLSTFTDHGWYIYVEGTELRYANIDGTAGTIATLQNPPFVDVAFSRNS